MNYELCKKLKEEGFPQRFLNLFDNNCKHENHDLSHIGMCCGVYEPTFSELIENCPKPMQIIVMPNGATTTMCFLGKGLCCNASTPKDSVASLWLESKKLKEI